MKAEWTSRVTKLAHKVLRERRLLKHFHLPLPSDLKKLAQTVEKQLKGLNLKREEADATSYRKAVKLAETRLVLYNKRRGGELEATL